MTRRAAIHGLASWARDAALPVPVGFWQRQTLKAAHLVNIRIHDLRQYFASGLIAAGCDVVTVGAHLAMRSAATTFRVYAHLWPSAEDRTSAAAAQFFAEAVCSDHLRTRTALDAANEERDRPIFTLKRNSTTLAS